MTQIQLRRDTAANWTTANPILASGEVGVETDTLLFKIGDGSTDWNTLDYSTSGGTGGATNLTTSRTPTQVVVGSSTGIDATIPAADATNAGVMTQAMQAKLAGIEPSADVTDTANVTAAGAVMTSTKNVANGVLGLNASGLANPAQLPSYVDDVLEYPNFAAFPGTGEVGKIYVALATGLQYRWSGTGYIQLVSSPGTTDAVTEGTTNLYYTNARADARVVAGITGKLDTSAAPELIRDTMGTALVAGTNVTVTPNDAGDTITIAASGATGGYTPGGTDVAITDGGTGVGTLPAGLLKGAGTSPITAAVPGTDYVVPGGTTTVAGGGTGRSTSTTAYGIITAGTTPTGAHQTINPGAAGQFLKSAGGSSLGSFASLSAADISDLAETVRDTVGTTLVQGSNVTITPNDTLDTITISASGTGGGSIGMVLVAAPTGVAATDTAAIQAAHDGLPATGGIILFQPGYYNLTATGVTISKPIIGQGQGTGNGVGSGGTVLVSNSAAAVGITLNAGAAGSVLRDIALVNQTTPTSGVGILGSVADLCVFERMYVMRFYDGISITSGISWTIDNCVINSPRRYGVRVQNTVNPDFGDSAIYNTKFLMDSAVPVADPAAAIRWETGGGFRVIGCKVNWASPTSFRYDIGVDIAYTNTTSSTADIFIHDNSFENMRTTGIKLSRPSGTQTVTGVQIHDNELMNVPTAIAVTTAGFPLTTIHDNTGIGSSMTTGVNIAGAASVPTVYGNIWDAAATPIVGTYKTPWPTLVQGSNITLTPSGNTITVAATGGSTPTPGTELVHDFTDDLDGTPVTSDDGGHSWSLTNNRTPNMTVVGGALVDTDTAAGLAAKYCSATLAGTTGYIKAGFSFTASGSTNGQVACIACWVTPLTSGAGGTVPDGPLHVTATNTEVTTGVWEDEVLTILGSWTYPALGTTPFTLEAVVNKLTSTVVVRGPDGHVEAYTHALIGAYTAPYVTVESFRTAANTDKQVRIRTFDANPWPPPLSGQMMYDIAVNDGGGGVGVDTVGWTELDASGTPSATTYVKVDAAGLLSAATPPSGGTPGPSSITYPMLASTGAGGTNKYLNVSAGGVMSLTTPSATAVPGGMSSGWVNVVTDFGADPTGVADSGPAFRNAATYANASFDRPIWVPAGSYTYNGAGMSGHHLHIEGPGVHQCSITLGAGTYFVDSGLNFYSFWLSGIHFKNGAGHVRHTSLVNNVHWNKVIQDCYFENYTNCSIQNNSNVDYADGDNPDWKVKNNYFTGANFTTTMGVALKGLTDSVVIEDNEFQKNRVGIKIDRGNNAHIHRNAFLRFGESEGFPRCDVWIVPVDPALNVDPFYAARAPGDGMTITANKFGSEFIESADKRVVIAQQSATGTWWGDKFPILTANSSYILNGITIDKNNYSPQTAMVYSTTPNLTGMCIGPNTIMWPGGFAPALTLRTATGFNHALNIVGPVLSNSINQLSPPSLVTTESGTLSGQPRSL